MFLIPDRGKVHAEGNIKAAGEPDNISTEETVTPDNPETVTADTGDIGATVEDILILPYLEEIEDLIRDLIKISFVCMVILCLNLACITGYLIIKELPR